MTALRQADAWGGFAYATSLTTIVSIHYPTHIHRLLPGIALRVGHVGGLWAEEDADEAAEVGADVFVGDVGGEPGVEGLLHVEGGGPAVLGFALEGAHADGHRVGVGGWGALEQGLRAGGWGLEIGD